jgi:glutamate N-acetyltransferase/amino-acid N-acetyltransferase
MIDGQEITVCGLAKGAGMIEPNMATMLSFIMTDVFIERDTLDKVFRNAVDKSFNAITVDGCMSTNDTALILANGKAGNKPLRGARNLQSFKTLLENVLSELSYLMVQDGEGATKVIEFLVEEAKSVSEARKIAYAVANSSLVKTAFYGGDPNWGRIIAAVGTVNERIPVNAVKVSFDQVPIFAEGHGVAGFEAELKEIMALPRISVRIQMGMGNGQFKLLSSDLTHEYVTINAHYHT